MPTTSRIYWDTSCFISLLNKREADRAAVCRDVLSHAQLGAIEIWTSTLTIAEVIRPKIKYVAKDLPVWSEALNATDKKGDPIYPGAHSEFEKIWHYFHRNTAPKQALPPDVVKQIRGMFAWDYIHLIQLTPAIAHYASDLSRDSGLKPADAIHTASALARKCATLHRYDRDFNKVGHLINIVEPAIVTQSLPLFKSVEAAIP